MLRHKLLLLGGITSCAALMFAQTLPPDLPSQHAGGIHSVDHSKSEVVERIFHLQRREYRSLMSWQEAESICGWDPSLPLPLSLDKAEEIARKELSKLVRDEIRWQFSEFSIGRFRAPTSHGENWYFALTMKPALAMGETNTDFFTVLINASGEPGRIIGRGVPSAKVR